MVAIDEEDTRSGVLDELVNEEDTPQMPGEWKSVQNETMKDLNNDWTTIRAVELGINWANGEATSRQLCLDRTDVRRSWRRTHGETTVFQEV